MDSLIGNLLLSGERGDVMITTNAWGPPEEEFDDVQRENFRKCFDLAADALIRFQPNEKLTIEASGDDLSPDQE